MENFLKKHPILCGSTVLGGCAFTLTYFTHQTNENKEIEPYNRKKHYPTEKKQRQKYRKENNLNSDQVADHIIPLSEIYEIGKYPNLYRYAPWTSVFNSDILPGKFQTQTQRNQYQAKFRTQSAIESKMQGGKISGHMKQKKKDQPYSRNHSDNLKSWNNLKEKNNLLFA